MKLLPPPPPKGLLTTLAAALVATVAVAPVWAQVPTVGMSGFTANQCAGGVSRKIRPVRKPISTSASASASET